MTNNNYVQSNFEMDSDKKELVKIIATRKGMTFKEFVNYAIDIAIKGETKEEANLLQDKQLLEKELKKIEDNYKNDKATIENNYKNDKAAIEDKYRNDKATIENKIKEIDITINNMAVENEEKSENDNYNKLVNMVYRGTRIGSIEDLIIDHATKYNLDVDELRRQIEKDVAYKKFMW